MLSMKTLRVAIVTVGSALLLGPGLAAAVTIKLDTRPTEMQEPPTFYAAETLTEDEDLGRTELFKVASPRAMDMNFTDGSNELMVTVRTSRRFEGGDNGDPPIFLRLELTGGAVFRNMTDTAVTAGSGLQAPSEKTQAGNHGQNFVVFRITADGTGASAGTLITVNLTNDISVPAGTGNYGATISAHANAGDAAAGVGADSIFGGSATIISVVNGLSTRLIPSRAVAEVDVGFLWFDDGPAPTNVKGQAVIGHVSVGAAPLIDGGVLHSAIDGTVISGPIGSVEDDPDTTEDGEDESMAPVNNLGQLVVANGVHVAVHGDLSIGAFSFVPGTPNADGTISQTCLGGNASPNNPDPGTLVDEDGDKLVDEEGMPTSDMVGFSGGLVTGIQSLCVNVDITGRGTNETPIPSTVYNATVSIEPPDAMGDSDDFIEAASGVIGRITRNGTSVKVAYLTISEKYNQRLIIANRGSTPARYDIGEFVTEMGTTVELSSAAEAAKDAGHNVVAPGAQVVLPVADILTFSGDRNRAGATVSVNSNYQNIQVATTQVNLEDGSTDTVVYRSLDDSAAGQ